MPSALSNYRKLPPALKDAVDRLAVSVVDQLAEAHPRVRRRRGIWILNTKAKLASGLARDLEDDLAEALKD